MSQHSVLCMYALTSPFLGLGYVHRKHWLTQAPFTFTWNLYRYPAGPPSAPMNALMETIIPLEMIPKMKDVEAEVYGAKAPLLSLTDKGREQNSMYYSPKAINFAKSSRLQRGPVPEDPSVDPDEIVLSVAIYHPQRHVKTEEFKVLGSQTLQDLRHEINCRLVLWTRSQGCAEGGLAVRGWDLEGGLGCARVAGDAQWSHGVGGGASRMHDA